MVKATNQLIYWLIDDKFDESLGIKWWGDKRKNRLSSLIKNLLRVKAIENKEDLLLDRLIEELKILQKYYEGKEEFSAFTSRFADASAKEINKKIDEIVNNLRALNYSVLVHEHVEELKSQGISSALIKNAMVLPQFGDNAESFLDFIDSQISIFPEKPLTKEQIFRFIVIRIITHCSHEAIEPPSINTIREHFNSQNKPSSYSTTQKAVREVIEAIKKLQGLYANYNKVFIARDGFVFYEAEKSLYRSVSRNVVYVSREAFLTEKEISDFRADTRLFQKRLPEHYSFIREAINRLVKEGHGNNADEIILRLGAVIKEKRSNDAVFDRIVGNVFDYIKRRVDLASGKLVFVDSCNRTMPLFLGSLVKSAYPGTDVKVFFWSTILTDPKAGLRLGEKENYLVDFGFQEYCEFDFERSTYQPFVPRIRPILFRTPGRKGINMKQPQAYMAHLVLQSELRK